MLCNNLWLDRMLFRLVICSDSQFAPMGIYDHAVMILIISRLER